MLLDRAQYGDEAALDELVRRESQPIFGLAYAMLRNRSDAQDVNQEVFLRALQHLDQFQQRGIPFHAYWAMTTRNLIRDRYRPISVNVPLHDVELVGPDEVAATVITSVALIHGAKVVIKRPAVGFRGSQ